MNRTRSRPARRRPTPPADRQATVERVRMSLKAPQWQERLEQARKPAGPPCARCGATETVLEACTEGPHYAAIRCAECNHFRGWAGWPAGHDDYDRSRRFVLPFGRYKSMTLESVGATPRGRQYLVWLNSQTDLKPALRRAIATYLRGDS